MSEMSLSSSALLFSFFLFLFSLFLFWLLCRDFSIPASSDRWNLCSFTRLTLAGEGGSTDVLSTSCSLGVFETGYSYVSSLSTLLSTPSSLSVVSSSLSSMTIGCRASQGGSCPTTSTSLPLSDDSCTTSTCPFWVALIPEVP